MNKYWFLPGFLLISACASHNAPSGRAGIPVPPNSRVTVVDATELPPPVKVDLFSDERPYYIGPFDKLKIDVFGVAEMSDKEIQADAGGNISFPLAGVVPASGRTPGELASLIEDRLRQFVRNPQVTVNLEETVSQTVTVDGQVTEPGQYPVIGRMTLMRAVASAKGTADFAKLNDVFVFRKVNGQQMAAVYDLRAVRRGMYPDPEIFANDIVVVGDSQARRIFKDVLTAAPLITTPLILLFQNR